jgi:hypothetical protein
MPMTGWIMLVFGCLVLYGGLSICLSIAKRGRGSDRSSER